MQRFEMKEFRGQLTSYAGLSLIGQCFEVVSAMPWLDGWLPASGGMKSSDIVKSMVGLLPVQRCSAYINSFAEADNGKPHQFRKGARLP